MLAVLGLIVSACGGGGADAADGEGASSVAGPLVIGGIPDQDVSLLEERFDGIADYLTREVGIPFEYRPATSYAAVVTAFEQGDVLLGWFGGLTGVQARLAVPDAHAVAQRPRDREFHSVFIVGAELEAAALADLAGRSFTFGSESSTSGHLMPRFFLGEAGIAPETDFDGLPGYSGSHDKTWKLVETGTFEAGVLNEAVWQAAVEDGAVDTTRVRVLETTPPYVDYHWVLQPDIDATYGAGTGQRIVDALLAMGSSAETQDAATLALFDTDAFIPTDNDAYLDIERVARELDLVGPDTTS